MLLISVTNHFCDAFCFPRYHASCKFNIVTQQKRLQVRSRVGRLSVLSQLANTRHQQQQHHVTNQQQLLSARNPSSSAAAAAADDDPQKKHFTILKQMYMEKCGKVLTSSSSSAIRPDRVGREWAGLDLGPSLDRVVSFFFCFAHWLANLLAVACCQFTLGFFATNIDETNTKILKHSSYCGCSASISSRWRMDFGCVKVFQVIFISQSRYF